MDYEEQYDKIYRYCYFRVGNPAVAEDITQETFLRFLESNTYRDEGKGLRYLYTIARNLCIDEYRKRVTEPLTEEFSVESPEEAMIEKLSVRMALEKLTKTERELLLLRYVNEVPVSVICSLQECSRFVLYRKMNQIVKKFKLALEEEEGRIS